MNEILTKHKWRIKFLDNLQRGIYNQEEALKDPEAAYIFALRVQDADVEKCQKVACREPHLAYRFALHIERADIEKCQKAACKESYNAYCFAKHIKGANIEMSIEACRGTEWEARLNQYLMEKALL